MHRVHPLVQAIKASPRPITPDFKRERRLEAHTERRLSRKLNKMLKLPKRSRHPWQLVSVNLARPDTWEEFIANRSLGVLALTTIEHTTIVAVRSRWPLSRRFRFYWCPGFPQSRLEEIQAAYSRLWDQAEANQTSSGQVFWDALATPWGGRRFRSREELTRLEHSAS